MTPRFAAFSLCLTGLLAINRTPMPFVRASDGPEWSYRGPSDSEDSSAVLSPKDWALGYPSCAGSSQSPIDFTDDDASGAAASRGVTIRQTPLLFEGDCANFSLQPGEHAFKWLAEDKWACQVCVQGDGAASYSLTRFQIHSPSEHTINGHAYDAEIQFVHALDDEAADKTTLIVSLFIEAHHTKNKLVQSEWMNSVWESMRYVNESVAIEESYADLVLQKMQMGDVYKYQGSLTTPPCTEEATWWVVRTPLYVSQIYLGNYEGMLGDLTGTDGGKNARTAQPRNGRKVTPFRDVVDQADEEELGSSLGEEDESEEEEEEEDDSAEEEDSEEGGSE